MARVVLATPQGTSAPRPSPTSDIPTWASPFVTRAEPADGNSFASSPIGGNDGGNTDAGKNDHSAETGSDSSSKPSHSSNEGNSSRKQKHSSTFRESSASNITFLAIVCSTGLANLLACVYIAFRAHPVRAAAAQADGTPAMEQPHALTPKQYAASQRHQDHRLAFYAITNDMLVTLIVTSSVVYSYMFGHLPDKMPCRMIGFGVYGLTTMDVAMSSLLTRTVRTVREALSSGSNAKHVLVHILHYTPGTIHAIAALIHRENAVIFVTGVAFVQMGAVMHAALIWQHERRRRKALLRAERCKRYFDTREDSYQDCNSSSSDMYNTSMVEEFPHRATPDAASDHLRRTWV
ncbi:hypothetical protein THASP1DRAFT_25485 [Thamnocephalis sphaerospora]|uniref:Uncharacterized protein n=1 Tax=Thamnocephalis sphaerospora TaxID=78915 RepID=A0A4V1IW31_9FUNG|nr:hypothetical protein THASP1DRAFT_25485 [Thamnocephalis sphaerospora]|eukprot:RKP06139.1 hypothetical protein THASP1DRAFT_25485 [Thamnocephalis sphaerospora]